MAVANTASRDGWPTSWLNAVVLGDAAKARHRGSGHADRALNRRQGAIGPDGRGRTGLEQQRAPQMIQWPGCLSEAALKGLDTSGECVPYSERENQAGIDRYLMSQAHEDIRRHSRGLREGKPPLVKRYEAAG